MEQSVLTTNAICSLIGQEQSTFSLADIFCKSSWGIPKLFTLKSDLFIWYLIWKKGKKNKKTVRNVCTNNIKVLLKRQACL